jgi:hypothetical protein
MVVYAIFYVFYFTYNYYPFMSINSRNVIMLTKDILGPLFLILMGIDLLHLLYKKYNYEFHQQQWTVIMFVLAEVITNFFFIFADVYNILPISVSEKDKSLG